MRILITGSRDWDNWVILSAALAQAAGDTEDVTVVHGACPSGADMMADCEARSYGFHTEPHPADWDRYGKAAGFFRNAEMVRAGADICLAFYQPGALNRGTTDCANRARHAGIPVMIYGQEITNHGQTTVVPEV